MPFGEKNNCAVYIDGEYVGTAKDIHIESFEPDNEALRDYIRENIVVSWDASRECTFTGTCKINMINMLKVVGLWKWVMDNCPNKRVVHLMEYGKNVRIKMKNYRRAIKEIGKYIVEGKR